jgi:hypothetical protein
MKRDLWGAEHHCQVCSWKMQKTKVTVQGMQIRAWECAKCSETVLHPEDAQKIFVLNKLRKGIPVKVGRLGTSLMVRFPKEFTEYYNIEKGRDLILRAEDESRFEITVD